jgi:hypothetical protein
LQRDDIEYNHKIILYCQEKEVNSEVAIKDPLGPVSFSFLDDPFATIRGSSNKVSSEA